MTRVLTAALGVALLCSATTALAQTAAPPTPQTVAIGDGDRAARIEKLVDSACGAAPASKAPKTDKDLYAECRATAKSRAESFVH